MQKGLYAIKLQDGSTIEIAFTTWVFKKFAQSKNLSLDELLDYMSGKREVNGNPSKITSEDMISLMLFGSEFMHLKAGKAFAYNDFHACQWLDDLGGITGEKIAEMTLAMFAALIDKDPTDVSKAYEIVADSEKKSSPGTASTSGQQKQGSPPKKRTAKR